jgi:hypothetical protein
MPIENKPHRSSSSALAHLDGLLDEALEQTFPASDAVAIDIERESHDRKARVLDSRTLLAGNRKVGQRTAQKQLTRIHQARARAHSEDAHELRSFTPELCCELEPHGVFGPAPDDDHHHPTSSAK